LDEDRTLIIRILEEITGILVKDLEMLPLDQKHHCAALSVEFVEMTDDDRNVFKRIVTAMEAGVYCTMQKHSTRVKLCGVQRKCSEVENNIDCIF
jgi:hypothetical protein